MVRCALEPDGNGMESEVPAWMFDGASCCRMTLAGAPSVAVSALLELRELVASAVGLSNSSMVKREHVSQPDLGGACETHEASTRSQTDDAVSSTVRGAAVDGFSARSARAGVEPAREAPKAPPRRASRCTGGAR